MGNRRFKILICRGPTCGGRRDSAALRGVLEAELEEAGVAADVDLDWQSCFGRCTQGPNLLVRPRPEVEEEPRFALAIMPPSRKKGRSALYSRLRAADMRDIVVEHLVRGKVVRRLTMPKPKKLDADDRRSDEAPEPLVPLSKRVIEGEK